MPQHESKRNKKVKKSGRVGRLPGIPNTPAVVSNLGSQIALFPQKIRRRLTYVEPGVTVVSGAGIGVSGGYVFSCNGLYDPNYTGGGTHQPLTFDQLMLMYNHYTVHSATINVLWIAGTATQSCVSLCRAGDNTSQTDCVKLIENGQITYQILPVAGAQSQYFKQNMSIDMAKFIGVDDVLDDSDLRGTVSANPVEQAFFHLNTWNPVGVAVVTNYAMVEMTFDATFTEPKVIPLS